LLPNLLLTGASGFIGSALLQALLHRNYPVLALVRDPARLASLPHTENLTILTCDLENITAQHAQQIIAFKPQAVIHTAWMGTENTDRNRPEFVHANLRSCLRLLEIAASAGCRHWIGFGSQAEYSPAIADKISETMPTFPDTAYGIAKLATAHTLKALCGAQDIRFAWLRLFASYGKNYHTSYVIPYLIECFRRKDIPLLKTPHAQWDYIHVDDVVCAAVAALEHPEAAGIFNLGNGIGYSIGDIAVCLAELMAFADMEGLRRQIEAAHDLPACRIANISHIRHSLGWQPQIDIREGLRRCIANS